MKPSCKLILLAFLLLLLSCKKKDEEIINVNMSVTNLVCFPDDSISLTFLINASNGTPPYSYNWIDPAGFVGAGPFTMNVKSDITLDVEVTDAINDKVKFLVEIKKDTIDSLRYDYRNAYTGIYPCEVIYRWAVMDSGGIFHYYDSTYYETLSVQKHPQFYMLMISHLPEVTYHPEDSAFLGPHTTARFRSDSIDAYYFMTPVGLYNWTYKGKRLSK